MLLKQLLAAGETSTQAAFLSPHGDDIGLTLGRTLIPFDFFCSHFATANDPACAFFLTFN